MQNGTCYTSRWKSQNLLSYGFKAFALVENHYFINKGFFPSDSFLLDNIDKIRHLPAIIIQVHHTFSSFVSHVADGADPISVIGTSRVVFNRTYDLCPGPI